MGAATTSPLAQGAATLVLPAATRNDAGIALAVDDLTAALATAGQPTVVTYRGPGDPLPAGDVILLNVTSAAAAQTAGAADSQTAPPQPPPSGQESDAFRIRPVASAERQTLAIEGAPRGLMYGAFKLAERIRLGDSPWQIDVQSAPAFRLRLFSELGQLFDLPDTAYYSDLPPYANEERLRRETEQLKQQLRHVAAGGFNAFCVMFLNIEDFVDYRYLDKQVYAPDDRHRLRSPVFCQYLKELCDAAHALHLEVYVQVYEFVYPRQLGEVYNLQLNRPMKDIVSSPELKQIIDARYQELFERVPLDGVIVTSTEPAPKCGYVSMPRAPWHTDLASFGRWATLYHNACTAAGGKCIVRLWRVASTAETVPEAFRAVTPEVTFDIKNTGGDFFLNHPLATAITAGVAKNQPLVVTYDTFREYDGWSRLFCYMKRWGERMRVCRDTGVIGVNAWGPFCPASNSGETKGLPWAGHWNAFRMLERGFTPGRANVYLLSRLAWDPDADVLQISRDFCALHLGRPNAAAGARALLASEDVFNEEYVRKAHPLHFRYTTMYWRRDDLLKVAFEANSLADIVASNARALAAIERMERAFAETTPAAAPDADTYARFREGIEKTALYNRTFYTFREGVWRSRSPEIKSLKGVEQQANAATLRDIQAQLQSLFQQWQRWPEEAGFWRIVCRPGQTPGPPEEFIEHWVGKENPGWAATMEEDAARFGHE
jgi:hypothetical protein